MDGNAEAQARCSPGNVISRKRVYSYQPLYITTFKPFFFFLEACAGDKLDGIKLKNMLHEGDHGASFNSAHNVLLWIAKQTPMVSVSSPGNVSLTVQVTIHFPTSQ